VPAETKRDQLPNCQGSCRHFESKDSSRRAPKSSSTDFTVNCLERRACRFFDLPFGGIRGGADFNPTVAVRRRFAVAKKQLMWLFFRV
jgi:hypothetical protein